MATTRYMQSKKLFATDALRLVHYNKWQLANLSEWPELLSERDLLPLFRDGLRTA
jgi:hypothetical protein